MAHLHLIAPGEAEGFGADAFYARIGEVTGREPTPFWSAQAVRPDLAMALWPWFEAVMLADGRLGRALKEMIATRVSYANACRYCSDAHSTRAKALGVPEAVVDRLADPVEQLPIDTAQRALLAFVDKVRDASPTIEAEDWVRVRDAGWTDEEIVESLHVIGMFSAFNRVADAFGVEFAMPAAVAR